MASEDFKRFIVEDPDNQYDPSFRIYRYDTVPLITTFVSTPNIHIPITMQTSDPKIKKEDLAKLTENEWEYMGRLTPEQLDAENTIYSFFLGLTGINTSGIGDIAGLIAGFSDSIPGWHEPESYDVYKVIPANPITTTIRVLVPVQGEPEPTVPSDEKEKPDEGIVSQIQIPDGSKVVYVRGEEVYLANIPTREVFQLTNDEIFDFSADLSPDGNLIVFTRVQSDYTADIWLMDVETRRIAKLTGEEKGGAFPGSSTINLLKSSEAMY